MRAVIPLIAVLGLAACASQTAKLPTCDGQHRRPANPYGSVLSDAGPPPASPAPSSASYQPCGVSQ